MKRRILVAGAAVGTMLFAFAAPAPIAQEKGSGVAEAKPVPEATQAERRREGEQMLGSFRDQARVSYAKTGTAPKTLTGTTKEGGCNVEKDELKGDYFKVHNKVHNLGANDAALIAEDHAEKDGFCLMRFQWASGKTTFSWYDTMEALIEANEDVKIEDKTTSSGEDETAEPEEIEDPYTLYRKLGRKWKHKSVVKIEGMDDMVSYIEYEVTEVTDEYAVYTMTMYDGDGKPMAGMEPMDTRIEFREYDAPDGGDAEAPEIKKETVKVEAGEYECYFTETSGTKAWSSIQYPGLLVKMESEYSVMELIEFSEGGDSEKGTEAKPDKPADDEGAAKPADMEGYWERYVSTFKKGRVWVYELAGGMNLQIKNEVTEVTETSATVKTTTLMGGKVMGEPSENEYDLTKPEDEGNPDDSVEWVEKEVECKAGTFVCISPGHGVWMLKKHPMIVVKAESMELVELKD